MVRIVSKIKATTIAEVVVALAVIAICFTVTSLVFIRSTRTTSRFRDVVRQTDIQQINYKKLIEQDNTLESEKQLPEGIDLKIITETQNDTIEIKQYVAEDERQLWKQQNIRR